MKRNVILAGGKNLYMDRLAAVLEEEGHSIAAGSENADMLVFCIDPAPCGRDDYAGLVHNYEAYALGLIRSVSACLPRLAQSPAKRLCFLTTLRASINHVSQPDHWERIIGAACNMAIRTLFNRLSREGYTFRVFAADDFTDDSASYAAEYFLQDRSLEAESYLHSDEKRLVLRDKFEKEYAW